MRLLPRETTATPAGWPDLTDELDRWGEAGRVATLWWRDDDAATATASLDRLLSIAGDVPIALAAIPAAADQGLRQRLTRSSRSTKPPRWIILQHGWRHANHAARGKKSEFPPGRSRRSVASDLAAGRARLIALFEDRALAVLAPPWNHFDGSFLPLLPACGLAAISRIKPRRTARPAPGVAEINVHVDLIAWRDDRRFIGEGAALAGLIGHLRARRLGEVDAEEPTGILTHHLVQDDRTDAFLHRFIAISSAHPATRWLDPVEAFASALS
jgi:hypothetical protein